MLALRQASCASIGLKLKLDLKLKQFWVIDQRLKSGRHAWTKVWRLDRLTRSPSGGKDGTDGLWTDHGRVHLSGTKT